MDRPIGAGACVALPFLLIALVVYYGGYFSFSPYYHWRAAKKAIGEHDFGEALKHLDICLLDWPTSAATHFLDAQTLRRAGLAEQARDHLAFAAAGGYPKEEVEPEAQMLAAELGQFRDMEPRLLGHLKRMPPGAASRDLVYEVLLIGYYKEEDLDAGRELASRWCEERPESWQPYYWRGSFSQALESQEAGVADMEKALQLRPDLLAVRRILARSQLDRGRYQESLALYQAVLEKVPDDPEAFWGLAKAMRSLGRFAESAEHVDRALQKKPDYADGLLLKAQLQLDQDEPTAALATLRRTEKLAPRLPGLVAALAQALRRLDSPDAKDYEQRSLELQQMRVRLVQAGDEVHRLQALGKLDSTQMVALTFEMADLYYRLGDDYRASIWVRHTLRYDPRHAPSLELQKRLAAPNP